MTDEKRIKMSRREMQKLGLGLAVAGLGCKDALANPLAHGHAHEHELDYDHDREMRLARLPKKMIKIDRAKPLGQEPSTGHNRWHPDVKPLLEVKEGEEVALETRDAGDGHFGLDSTLEKDLKTWNPGTIHPMTGPISIPGAMPGDLLEVEFLDIIPEKWGFSIIVPGLGYLADLFKAPYLVHWKINKGFATSPEIPGVKLPAAPFMGLAGLAPSKEQLAKWTARENALLQKKEPGVVVFPPDKSGATPAEGPIATAGLRTIPPRENGGNMDIKQLTKGSKMFIPVGVPGALFSAGDAHFCQGDGEVCLTAVEMPATCVVKFKVHKGEAEKNKITMPYFSRTTMWQDPKYAMPHSFTATMGIPITADGTQKAGDLNVAFRNALLSMIDVLMRRGFTQEQAYVICSVAVDFKVNNVVDTPNFIVSAYLPDHIFEK